MHVKNHSFFARKTAWTLHALDLLFSMPIVFGFGELAYKKSVPTMKRKMNDQPDHSEPSGLAKYFTALTKSENRFRFNLKYFRYP